VKHHISKKGANQKVDEAVFIIFVVLWINDISLWAGQYCEIKSKGHSNGHQNHKYLCTYTNRETHWTGYLCV